MKTGDELEELMGECGGRDFQTWATLTAYFMLLMKEKVVPYSFYLPYLFLLPFSFLVTSLNVARSLCM